MTWFEEMLVLYAWSILEYSSIASFFLQAEVDMSVQLALVLLAGLDDL